jgi:hypothetical protein
VVDLKKIDRLAQLAGKARTIVCVDDLDAVDNLSKAAQKYGTTIESAGLVVAACNGASRSCASRRRSLRHPG